MNAPKASHRFRVRSWLLAATLVLAAGGEATAELHVLLAFDEEGYRVGRVVRGGGPGDVFGKHAVKESPPTASSTPPASVYGEIELDWIGRDRRVIVTERAPDPRIAHSVVGAEWGSARRVALSRGAWLARGPEPAVTLRIRLPARPSLALAPEDWQFDLEAAEVTAVPSGR